MRSDRSPGGLTRQTNSDDGAGATSRPALIILAFFACLCVGAGAIDRQPFWLDELGTWAAARPAGLGAWFRSFLAITNSDGQLPLYHFLVFQWSQFAGLGEVGIRSLNLVFLLIAVVSIVVSRLLPLKTRIAWAALMLGSCFVWAYLNEARPYLLLVAGSTWLVLALVAIDGAEEGARGARDTLVLFLPGALVSFGASPIASPYILAILVGILVVNRTAGWADLGAALARHWLLLVACAVIGAAILALVLYSMLKGATPELRNSSSVPSLLFGLIEVFGGGGFVPGRETLRTHGLKALEWWNWLALFVCAATTIAVCLQAFISRYRQLVTVLLVACGISVLAVGAAGYMMHFRVVGRHFAFVLPALLLILAIGLVEARRRAAHAAGPLLIALLALSTVLFRADQSHGKDQTGVVAQAARSTEARRGTVWWVGSFIVPAYFKFCTVPLRSSLTIPAPCVIHADEDEDWRDAGQHLAPPDIIIVERPEAADTDGFFARKAAAAELTEHVALRGYVMYRRPQADGS